AEGCSTAWRERRSGGGSDKEALWQLNWQHHGYCHPRDHPGIQHWIYLIHTKYRNRDPARRRGRHHYHALYFGDGENQGNRDNEGDRRPDQLHTFALSVRSGNDWHVWSEPCPAAWDRGWVCSDSRVCRAGSWFFWAYSCLPASRPCKR